jgi:competence ComEA-like helix-hairpin-helix protein
MLVFGLAVRALAAGLLGAASSATATRLVAFRVDLNRASVAELQVLPGIGAVRAEAIVLHRIRRGPFRRLEDLDEVDGIGHGTVAALRPHALAGVEAASGGTTIVEPARRAAR